eukprot:3237076-Pyramimonas_sp.AAC.1
MAAERWESCSHATGVCKLYAILNAGFFLPSKLRWGMRAKSDKKAEDKAPAEGVYAFHESDTVHYLHQGYSHGAEHWGDGNIVAVDFKLATPPAARGGFRPVDTESKGRKQFVCSAPELLVKQSMRLYFMTPCQANQQQ